jgi:hypothetical protein
LFEFGDRDGERLQARLQHCLAVVYHDGKLYVADTYNHKIKVVDPDTGETRTLVGTGNAGNADEPAEFHEPAGLSYAAGQLYVADTNNHLIRTIDLNTGKVATLAIEGLEPPTTAEQPSKPDFADADRIQVPVTVVRPEEGKIQIRISLQLPEGWKVNDLAPVQYWIESPASEGPIDRSALVAGEIEQPSAEFDLILPVSSEGKDQLEVSVIYYYCQTNGALCKVGSAVLSLPIEIGATGVPQVLANIEVGDRFP